MLDNKKKRVLEQDYLFVFLGVFLGVLSTSTVLSPFLSGFISVVENIIVLYLIIKQNFSKAFFYYVLFICLSIEQNAFIYGEGAPEDVDRYYFFSMPLFRGYLYMFLSAFFYFKFRKMFSNSTLSEDANILRKWMFWLAGLGMVSILIGIIINDNGILYSGNYPRAAIQQLLSFSGLFFIILASLEYAKNRARRRELSNYCQLILVNVAITAIITSCILGVTGLYSIYVIMLTPIAIALTPMLILFSAHTVDASYKILSLVIGILIVLVSFLYPTCIGSKWYLIILASVFGFLLLIVKTRSVLIFVVIAAALVSVVLIYGDSFLGSIGNEYVAYKLSQTLNLINVAGNSSITDSFYGLDNSTLYRFDEPYNTFIEYSNKPLFAIFGKGFAGTTRHYTDLLAWEFDSGAFSEEQIKAGAYYSMHETFAVLFLRHGLLGISFFFYVIYKLFKKASSTPWAIIAFIWFLFYWSYGISAMVGAVALAIVFSTPAKNSLKRKVSIDKAS